MIVHIHTFVFLFFMLSTKIIYFSSKFVLIFILKTFQLRHCRNCNKDYSDKFFGKHCRTNNHLGKAFGVKYIYKKENILVNEIDNTLSNIIEEHKRKLHFF